LKNCTEDLKHKDGWLQLDKGNVIALNGLDGYTSQTS
jgi:hypothetical protein